MNTQSHMLINLFLLRWIFKENKLLHKVERFNPLALLGAVVPDAPMFVFFLWYAFIDRVPQRYLWDVLYYSEGWQIFFNIFNSAPFFLVILLLGLQGRQLGLVAFSSSALLHVVGDFFLHVDDGHAHFFPFTNWAFVSPVSYWDPGHHGQLWSLIEFAIILVACVYLWKTALD